jgi:hypothetical protein
VRNLTEVRDLKHELADAGDWIFFGPHAVDYDNAPFSQNKEEQIAYYDNAYNEIDRFAGNTRYAKWVRLHYFSESFELADYFSARGVEALFATDKPSGSHRMPDEIKSNLVNIGCATYEGMNFIRTHYRIENFANEKLTPSQIEESFKQTLAKYGFIIIFTHEYEFLREDVCEYVKNVFSIFDMLSLKCVKTI